MKRIRHYAQLAYYRAIADLRAEATRAYLGLLWWFVEPLMYMVVFYTIFKTGLRAGGVGYAPFLLTGMVVWKWFASTVIAGANAVAKNSAIMQQVYVPKALLPCVVLIANTIKFLIIFMFLLLLIVVVLHKPVSWPWLALPLVIGVQFLFIAGVGGLVASVVPFVPDIKLLLDNVMMMLFFVSGVFFDISHIHGRFHDILLLNPAALVIEAYRSILLHNRWPHWGHMAYVFILSLVLVTAAVKVFHKYDRIYPKLVY